MTKLRIFLFVFFIVSVAVLIVFPYRNKAAVSLSFLGNLSGNGSRHDVSACNGAMLAVDSVNRRGGVKGRRLKLSIYDAKGQPGKIEKICNQMKEKKSGLLLAPYPHKNRLGDCMPKKEILPLTFGFSGSSEGNACCLAFYSRAKASGAAIGDLALVREIRRVTVLYDASTYPFGPAFLDGFRNAYRERGGRIEAELRFDGSGETDFETLVAKVGTDTLQGVVIVASGRATGRLGRAFRKAGPSIALYAAPWAFIEGPAPGPERFAGLDGLATYAEAAAGMGSSALAAFYSAYEQRYGSPADLSAIFGYEAVLILAEGIRNSASPGPFLVKHTLAKMFRFKGLVSNYTLGREDAGEGALFFGKSGREVSPEQSKQGAGRTDPL